MKKFILLASILLSGCQDAGDARNAGEAQSADVPLKSAGGAPEIGHYVEIPTDQIESVVVLAKSGDVQAIQRLEAHYAYVYDLAAHNAEQLKKEHEKWKALLLDKCSHSKCEPLEL